MYCDIKIIKSISIFNASYISKHIHITKTKSYNIPNTNPNLNSPATMVMIIGYDFWLLQNDITFILSIPFNILTIPIEEEERDDIILIYEFFEYTH